MRQPVLVEVTSLRGGGALLLLGLEGTVMAWSSSGGSGGVSGRTLWRKERCRKRGQRTLRGCGGRT
eukprot:9860701-Alexandrium_andersonii.AAC.1